MTEISFQTVPQFTSQPWERGQRLTFESSETNDLTPFANVSDGDVIALGNRKFQVAGFIHLSYARGAGLKTVSVAGSFVE